MTAAAEQPTRSDEEAVRRWVLDRSGTNLPPEEKAVWDVLLKENDYDTSPLYGVHRATLAQATGLSVEAVAAALVHVIELGYLSVSLMTTATGYDDDEDRDLDEALEAWDDSHVESAEEWQALVEEAREAGY